MNRRTFLKIAGMGSVSLAAGCGSKPEKNLYALVEAPEDMVTGTAAWYASTCRECPAGCGVLAKNREGRVIKLEGNPAHPINAGGLCLRGHAALQGVYNPDRITTPLLREKDRWMPLGFAEAESLLREKATAAAAKGPDRVRMMSEVAGDALLSLFSRSMAQWHAKPPLVFEPLAYESLKTANQQTFGVAGLPGLRMEQADVLVSFGADFLDTWLSPVEYARKFKSMHTLQAGDRKGRFFFIGPYQSVTGANADRWLPCIPGGEAAVALGLLRDLLAADRGLALPANVRAAAAQAAAPYDRKTVQEHSGIPAALLDALRDHLLSAQKPLILGTGSEASGPNGLPTNVAVNLLNLVLDPELSLVDFENRHRVEIAATRAETLKFLDILQNDRVDLLLLNNVDPVHSLPSATGAADALEKGSFFIVSFSAFMDDTTRLADLIIPPRLPLETWDLYTGKSNLISTLQPTMGQLTKARSLGDIFLAAAFGKTPPYPNYRAYLFATLQQNGRLTDAKGWTETLRQGGLFAPEPPQPPAPSWKPTDGFADLIGKLEPPHGAEPVVVAAPSIRYLDGRGTNRPWLSEIPDPLSQVAWQNPVWIHPDTLTARKIKQGDVLRLETRWGKLEAPVYATDGVRPGVLVMGRGQGHIDFGRYARNRGANPMRLMAPAAEAISGGGLCAAALVNLLPTGQTAALAHTDGSRTQHGRKIAVTVNLKALGQDAPPPRGGLTMWSFPLTLPLPEGYDPQRDVYPPHEHQDYRWAMIVDLDRCVGCGACVAACYAENNLGIAGEEQILAGREMSWIRIERYLDPEHPERVTFLPMLCQHCDNAPCESVCPVYAPHHSKEGLNNQIYNRCIGTRFCSQNCPYKVRRFNWFTWQWPKPLDLQLNPEVTVRSKGVMEKCSFCVQRIKHAHDAAKDENRAIRDGEIQPACLQTCPTGVFTFGNLMDPQSRVRQMVADRRAYQVLGYLNTKPAVIYLKKVVQEV